MKFLIILIVLIANHFANALPSLAPDLVARRGQIDRFRQMSIARAVSETAQRIQSLAHRSRSFSGELEDKYNAVLADRCHNEATNCFLFESDLYPDSKNPDNVLLFRVEYSTSRGESPITNFALQHSQFCSGACNFENLNNQVTNVANSRIQLHSGTIPSLDEFMKDMAFSVYSARTHSWIRQHGEGQDAFALRICSFDNFLNLATYNPVKLLGCSHVTENYISIVNRSLQEQSYSLDPFVSLSYSPIFVLNFMGAPSFRHEREVHLLIISVPRSSLPESTSAETELRPAGSYAHFANDFFSFDDEEGEIDAMYLIPAEDIKDVYTLPVP